jgi:hypothetical protein
MNRAAWLLAASLLLAADAGFAAEDAAAASPLAIVEGAFDRMFNYASVRSVTLRIHRGGRPAALRRFDVAYARSEGRGRTLLRFREPEYLRGSALLILEEPDGRSDVWIYQPALRRPRRIAAAHKGDAFFGSDLSYEDLEHHAWRRFSLTRRPDASLEGRPCFVVEATPPSDSQYSKAVAFVEQERLALLRLDLHRGGSERPVKSLVVAPGEIAEVDGVLAPRRMWMRQEGRDAATEVVFDRIRSGAPIASEVFAAMRLERSGEDLFALVERLRREEESR